MTAALLVLLAASPFVAANAARRQVSLGDLSVGDLATLSDISIGDILPTGSDFASAFPTSILADLTKCAPPATITPPAGLPTLGSAAQRYAVTASDPCALYGSGAPSAVAADVSSYTSAISQWASQNSQALSSYESAISSFVDSVKTDSVCSSLYATTGSAIPTDPQLACSSLLGGIFGTGSTSAGASAGTTTTSAGNTAAVSGQSGSGANGTGAGATIAPHNTVLMAGASIALTSLLGMILL